MPHNRTPHRRQLRADAERESLRRERDRLRAFALILTLPPLPPPVRAHAPGR